MNGLALTILVGQLPKLFGFSTDASGLIDEARAFADGVATGETVGAALAIGLLGLALIAGLRTVPAPGPGGARRSRRLDPGRLPVRPRQSRRKAGGDAAAGVPAAYRPQPHVRSPAAGGRCARDRPGLTRRHDRHRVAFAARAGQEVDGNVEMVGIGAANIAAGFFQGFPVSTSGSRTAVAEQAGAKTQLTGVVGAGADRADARAGPRTAREPPEPDARRGGDRRVDVAGRHPRDRAAASDSARSSSCCRSPPSWASRCWACSRASRSPWRCRSSTCSAGPGGLTRRFSGGSTASPGITTGELIPTPKTCRGSSSPVRRAAVLRQHPNVPGADQRSGGRRSPPGWILIAAEPMTDVDTTAADMLADLDGAINASGASLVFAELKDPVRAKVERYELTAPSTLTTSSPPSTPRSPPSAGRPARTGCQRGGR